MAKYIPNSTYDLMLNRIATADFESVCHTFPDTFYNACHSDLWVAETAYDLGDVVRPPTDNNMVYECTTAGTSGASEPAWGETQDVTFNDGTVVWKLLEDSTLIDKSAFEISLTIR